MNAVAVGIDVPGVARAETPQDADVVVLPADDRRVLELLAEGRLLVALGESPPGLDAGIDLLIAESPDDAARLVSAIRRDPEAFRRVRAMGQLTAQRVR